MLAWFFRVDAVYLDSVLESLSLPAHLDPVLGVVQSSIAFQCLVRALASAVVDVVCSVQPSFV